MEMIRMENGVKAFGQYKVLDQVSFACNAGEITGFVGENGSGKSVIFKCLCGFYLLDDGAIYVEGKKRTNRLETLQNAGILIESPAFIDRYSGMRNLELLYMMTHRKDRAYLQTLMKRVGLNPDNRTHVAKYSMGMKQRLGISEAILDDRPILILDEPFNGLDHQGVEEMRELFLELKEQGKTILLASHNREDIDILCDRVYEMDAGKLA